MILFESMPERSFNLDLPLGCRYPAPEEMYLGFRSSITEQQRTERAEIVLGEACQFARLDLPLPLLDVAQGLIVCETHPGSGFRNRQASRLPGTLQPSRQVDVSHWPLHP